MLSATVQMGGPVLRSGAFSFCKESFMKRNNPVIILGAGGVGRALIEQIVAAREQHAARMGGRFDVVAVADSRSWRWAPQGLDDAALLQLVAAKNEARRSSTRSRGKQRPPAPLFGE